MNLTTVDPSKLDDLTRGLPLAGSPVGPQTRVGWSIFLRDKEGGVYQVEDAAQLVLVNPIYGALVYGQAPAGPYDTWTWTEVGGGGSIVVPWTIMKGVIYVGVLIEWRPLARATSGQFVLNVPRGSIDPEETHDDAASRELVEEVGLPPERRLVKFDCEPGNCDNANTNTAFLLPSGKQAGLRYYACRFDSEELEPVDGTNRLRISAPLTPAHGSIGEKIIKVEFVPVREAAKICGDNFTRAGIGLLLTSDLISA